MWHKPTCNTQVYLRTKEVSDEQKGSRQFKYARLTTSSSLQLRSSAAARRNPHRPSTLLSATAVPRSTPPPAPASRLSPGASPDSLPHLRHLRRRSAAPSRASAAGSPPVARASRLCSRAPTLTVRCRSKPTVPRCSTGPGVTRARQRSTVSLSSRPRTCPP
ncbi:hypothetical protein PHLGIDRAFT_455801 [Phlebiopsis gigantea 11061_1 CR5-6]|uniref:Uncharacterized protein n=1 Tax=Phlebiopsis gigantea (strain 11061_1 CR5-6) TaxID=745531 RepID=A0A0C3SF66_PHLG1|nr:hypothetical protein PHLGIDRAFT_455801 [Phlebiopsis gigantea 11061_1 CR5-6]